MVQFTIAPTADMPISSLHIAILNYIVSQQRNEPFLVCIDDLESEKNLEGKDSEIMQILEKFALKHTSVFHQSEHLNLYQTLALRLLKEKKAFICKCLRDSSCSNNCKELSSKEHETLKSAKERFLIRLTGDSSIVIMQEDGKPSYAFASATDEMMSGVIMIIQEEQHLKDYPKQIAIQKLLGYEKSIETISIPSILNAPSLLSLFEEGFVPDAILNYLLLLANPQTPQEIFTLPNAIKFFSLDDIPTSSPTFELDKLRHINREHLKLMDNKQLSTLFGFADADIGKLAKFYLTKECFTIKALESKIRPIFTPKTFSWKWAKEMKLLSEIIFQAPYFEEFEPFKAHLKAQSKLEDDTLLPALNQLLTNSEERVELSELYPFIKSYILEVTS